MKNRFFGERETSKDMVRNTQKKTTKKTNKQLEAKTWSVRRQCVCKWTRVRSHRKKAIHHGTETSAIIRSLSFDYFTFGSAFKGHRFSSFYTRRFIYRGSWSLTASEMKINAVVSGAPNKYLQLLSADCVTTQTEMKERYSDLASVFISVWVFFWCIMMKIASVMGKNYKNIL